MSNLQARSFRRWELPRIGLGLFHAMAVDLLAGGQCTAHGNIGRGMVTLGRLLDSSRILAALRGRIGVRTLRGRLGARCRPIRV